MCNRSNTPEIRFFARAHEQRKHAYMQFSAMAQRAKCEREKKMYAVAANRYKELSEQALYELMAAKARKALS